MAEREVIREFLARLGFQVDQPSLRNWLSMLKKACLTAGNLQAAILGVVVALEALVTAFARGMEKLYYSSIRTKASVANIQALEFALGQVGVEGEQARAILENLATNLRMNPGTKGFLNMLGIDETGKDRLQVVMEILTKLKDRFKGQQYMVGASFAEQLLGIDERTYFQLTTRLPELQAAIAKHQRLQKESGLDPEDAARAAREFMNELRELWRIVGMISDRAAMDLLPVLREINAVVREAVRYINMLDFGNFEASIAKIKKEWGDLGEVIAHVLRLLWTASKLANPLNFKGNVEDLIKGGRDFVDRLRGGTPGGTRETGGRISPAAAPVNPGFPVESPSDAAAAARRALDIMMGERARGEGGADLDREIARTESMIRRLEGAPSIPAGAARATAGAGTRETSGGIVMTVNSTVNVSGASDPAATASAVDRTQRRLYGDAIRNLEGVTR